MLTNFSNVKYVLKLDYKEAFELINYAIEQKNEKDMYYFWLHACSQNESYQEFKNRNIKVDNEEDTETTEEIVDSVINMFDDFF